MRKGYMWVRGQVLAVLVVGATALSAAADTNGVDDIVSAVQSKVTAVTAGVAAVTVSALLIWGIMFAARRVKGGASAGAGR